MFDYSNTIIMFSQEGLKNILSRVKESSQRVDT